MLVLPFLLHSVFDILLFAALGGFLTAAFFKLNLFPGIAALATVTIIGLFALHLWRNIVVFYKKIKNKENEEQDYQKDVFIPSAPQHFDELER